jgi:hypothetical protein
MFGKNLVRFKYHDRQANSNDCNFEPLVFAAALQKVRGTLEELEIRADELWGDVTIGSLQDFPRLKRITISHLLLVQYETEARLIDKLPLGLSYLSLVHTLAGDNFMLQEFPRRFRDTMTELIEGKAAGIFPFLKELNIVVRYWNGQERYQAVGQSVILLSPGG